MSRNSLILPLTGVLPAAETGAKAQSLLFLRKKGFRVPRSYLVPARVNEEFLHAGECVAGQLEKEIGKLPPLRYAVRSSARGEDGTMHSCAGQFLTLVDRKGKEEVLSAIFEVWESAARVAGGDYFRLAGAGNQASGCAVIVQEMVDARYSGVSFSRNPVTGNDEIIVEAVEGSGEQLVQKGITPLRWKFRGKTMAEGSGAHPLSPVVRKVASATRKLMRSSGFPSDIEWVWDGKKLWFLQLRRITGETRLTTYSSRMAGEMLPGQIKPLVWSVNIPLVVGAKTALLEEITGPLPVKPGELVRSFYYRTYFNMDKLGEILSCVGLPVESPENVMRGDHHHMSGFRPGWKTIRHARRLIRFVRQKLKYPVLFEQEYRKLKENTQALQLELQEEFQPSRYSLLFDKLYSNAQRLAHFNIVIPLLMRIYTNRLRKKMEKAAIPFDQNRFNEVFPELTVLSPSGLMDTIRKAWKALSPTVKNGISHPGDLQFHPETTSLAADFGLLMEKFGHFSRSGNDFSNPKWEEDPAGV